MKFLCLTLCLSLCACTEKQDYFYGEVAATEVDVGVKIPGRIKDIQVSEGQAVSKDFVMGFLESPEVAAKMMSAKAGKGAARDQLKLARTTYERVEKLYEEGAVTRQQRDEARFKYEASRAQLSASEGVVGEVTAAADETQIKSPIEGEVLQIVSNVGELISPGYPVITVVNLKDQWVVFNVREDRLKDFKKDQTVKVKIPALDKEYSMKITYISALGAFAKWKSTNEQGRFDLKTFELRARPSESIEGLRPGMTALVSL
ncbi:HlyD family secretion protein [Bdellovibrio sp. NC01]|uniref:HlyD family secretion protein n=1 Tax=Bdellovibrio sp. NC01 TaxID=2220073 RepID=UPI00115704A4|nr:efflux RND transporter periplasmic adaptor subunit [Bdellovibrio sp. NC01]QDK38106.1 HlyD family secretion protein [Bdellovibrio sp. NC01]